MYSLIVHDLFSDEVFDLGLMHFASGALYDECYRQLTSLIICVSNNCGFVDTGVRLKQVLQFRRSNLQ